MVTRFPSDLNSRTESHETDDLYAIKVRLAELTNDRLKERLNLKEPLNLKERLNLKEPLNLNERLSPKAR